jgi:protein-disulfide isomerase
MTRTQGTRLTAPVTATDHQRGPEHAPVTMVEYGDFECPHCGNAEPFVRELLSRFDQKLRLVYRHMPLESIHLHALDAALAAECAGAQGKFWEMHDLLFAHQAHLGRERLEGYAKQLGLDMPRFIAEMDDQIYLQRIREHIDGARASGVQGTPGIFINGVSQDLSRGFSAVAATIEARLR